MTSANPWTACESTLTVTTAQGPLPNSSPAATNTMGPVTSRRSRRPESNDQPNSMTTNTSVGSALTTHPGMDRGALAGSGHARSEHASGPAGHR